MKSKYDGSLLKHQINKVTHATLLKTHTITPVLMLNTLTVWAIQDPARGIVINFNSVNYVASKNLSLYFKQRNVNIKVAFRSFQYHSRSQY